MAKPKLKQGDRVIYVSGNYGSAGNNPLTPGRFACVGTVDNRPVYTYKILVDWDNGHHNTYSEFDLKLAKDSGKPLHFVLEKGDAKCIQHVLQDIVR